MCAQPRECRFAFRDGTGGLVTTGRIEDAGNRVVAPALPHGQMLLRPGARFAPMRDAIRRCGFGISGQQAIPRGVALITIGQVAARVHIGGLAGGDSEPYPGARRWGVRPDSVECLQKIAPPNDSGVPVLCASPSG